MVLSPPLLGSEPVRFNLNSFCKTAGSFMCLNCVMVCYYFVLLQLMRMFVSNRQKKIGDAHACLHICVYAQAYVLVSDGFEKYCEHWTSVREGPAVI